MSGAYYNEIDPYTAQWLRNLIAAGHIAPGDVDERDIRLVRANELRGYTQCHFFAGIGVWSHALRLAGWPDDEQIWSGSCPCQPFSTAGTGKGHEDERHLWPTWFGLIRESRPNAFVGEQVADGDGYAWLDHVGHDVEGIGYALGAVSPAACGFGAPHERQRLFFVADASSTGTRRDPRNAPSAPQEGNSEGRQHRGDLAGSSISRSSARELADAASSGIRTGLCGGGQGERWGLLPANDSGDVALAHSGSQGPSEQRRRRQQPEGSATAGFWRDCEWLLHRDGKWRPVESGTFPLAHGAPARVGRLRAYGNAIVAPVAAEFIRAYREVREM